MHRFLTFLACAFVALPSFVHAAPGDLDATFGTGGQVTTPIGGPFGAMARSMAVQNDGKIVVAGYCVVGESQNFAVVRYEANGALDPSFGVGGKVITPVGSGASQGGGVAIQMDGKIVVAGYAGAEVALVRYETNGMLDGSFGIGGKVTTQVGTGVTGRAVALQSDGKILVVGDSGDDFALVRYNSDGGLDTSFNGTGFAITPVGSSYDIAYKVVVQPDGKIVVSGDTFDSNFFRHIGVVRYNSNGSLDQAFNGTGKRILSLGLGGSSGSGVALQSDGKIVVAGSYFDDFAVTRFSSNGSLDTTFNGSGSVVTPIGNSGDLGRDVVIQSDGKILVAGYSQTPENSQFAVVRYRSNGNLDTTFGGDGKITTAVNGTSYSNNVSSIVLQSDGKILVAGEAGDGFAVVRYLGDNSTDAPVLTSPADFAATKSPISVDFTLPEAALANSLKLDFGAITLTLANTLGTVGQHTFTFNPANPAASSAIASVTGGSSIADGTYTVTLRYQDTAGNAEASATSANVVVDTVTQTPMLSQVTSAPFQGRQIGVNFILPEDAQLGSVKLTFTGVGAPKVLTLSNFFGPANPYGFSFDPDSPGASGNFTGSPSPLGDGTYAVTLSYQDALGNPAATSSAVNGVVVGSGSVPGTVDALDVNVVGAVNAAVMQPDGKTIIVGTFNSVRGVQRRHIARLHADGTLDLDFDPKANGEILSVIVQEDGKILLGGFFTNFQPNGAPDPMTRAYLARINADGSLDTGFDPNPNQRVYSMAVQADGKVVLGGQFTALQPNGAPTPTTRHRIARVHADGTLDLGFDPKASDTVLSVAVQADGKVLLGGIFGSLRPNDTPSSTQRSRIARVNADGSLDPGFDPYANHSVVSMAVQADGKVLLGGAFTTLQPNGAASATTRNRIGRVRADGSLDLDFDPKANQEVFSVAVGADGKILLGGAFDELQPNGASSPTTRSSFARLINDDATQTLTVPDPMQVQWQRSGAGPELVGVRFERSLDGGATWTSLGQGTRVGTSANWQLTGQNLSNQFGLIRAFGRTMGGIYNGSSGLVAQTVPFDFDTFLVGNTTPFPNNGNFNPHQLAGRLVNLPASVLVGLGAIYNSSGTTGNLALYKPDGVSGRPGTLVAQTGAFTVVSGTRDFAVSTPTPIAAGDYWLVGVYDGFTAIGVDNGGLLVPSYSLNPFGFTGDLPATLTGGIRFSGTPANYYVRLGTLSPVPTLTKPASNFTTKTNFDVDFTLPQPAQAGSLTLTFAGAVTRTFTLAGSLLGAGQHGFNFNPADPIGTSSGAIASANVNDLPEGFYNVTLSYRNLNNEGPGTAVSGNVVFDKTAPQLTRPTTFTAEATAANGAMVDFSAEVFAIDNVDPAPTVIGTPANGTLFPIGNTTVNVTATDVAGNETTGSFTVKVQDTTAPQFVSPTPTGTLTFEAALSFSSSGGTAVNYDLVATDLVDASPEIVLTAGLPSGSIFPLGGTTVAFKATDDSGNSVTGDFQVVITDTTAPMLTAPTGTLTVEATSAAGAVVTFNTSATDIADPAPVVVATPASGSTFPFGSTTVNVTATDASQNQTTAMFTVFVQDATGPVIATHPNVSVLAPGLGGVVVNYAAATATDATGVDTITYSKESGTIFPLGTTTVTVNATDTLGNPATPVTFDVIVHLAAPQSTVVRAKGSEAPGRGTNGLPSEAILASFGVPAIDDLGNVAFTAKWTSDDGKVKGSGLFTDDACLAIVGGDASSIATSAKFKSFGDPVISEGSIAVIAGLTAKATPSVVLSNVAVATTLEAVARVGDVAPDKDGVQPTGGAKFKTFKGVAIDGGAVLIFAQLIGGTGTEKTTPANDLGLWMKVGPNALRRVLRENDSVQVQDVPLVTRKIKTLVSFGAGNGSPGAGRGWLAQPYDFMALARVTFDDKSQAVLASTSTGNIQIYSLSGVAGMGGPAITDATFASYSFPATNDGYNVAFLGSLTVGAGGVTKVDARGVFVSNGAGAYTALARVGGNAPGTDAKFSVLKDPVLDDGEGVTFPATIKGGTAKGLGLTTLWWRPSMGTLTLLAQGGPTTLGVSHDLPVGAQWKSFTSLAVASNRGPLFTGTLVPKKGSVTAKDANGVWAMDFEGKLRTLFRTGATNIINGKTLASFKLLSATVGSTGVPRSFTATQKIVWLATFADKSQAIVTTEVP